jgi:hypothetical protein
VKSADGLFTPTHTVPVPIGIGGIGAVFQPGCMATLPVSASRKPGWVPLPLSVYSPRRTVAAAPAT